MRISQILFARGIRRADKSVSAAGQRLDVARVVRGIIQRATQFVDGGIHAVVEIHEGVGGPEPSPQLFTRDDFSAVLQQSHQDLKGLILKLDFEAMFSQLTTPSIRFKRTEVETICAVKLFFRHSGPRVPDVSFLQRKADWLGPVVPSCFVLSACYFFGI